MALHFDPDTHTYTLDGMPLPGVTGVLADVGLIDYTGAPEEALHRGMERGSLIHAAIYADIENDLDESSVPPEYMGFLEASRAARAGLQVVPLQVEVPAYHPDMLYAGTPDLIAAATLGGRRVENVVIDWKSGKAPSWVRYQLAAYASFFPNPGSYTRLCVELHADATYRIEPLKVADFRRDWNVFQAALTIYRAKREIRRHT
jgi:hypothetical protein